MNVPCFAQSVSICISRVLEDIGVNEATVAKRRELYHQAEVIKEIGHNLLAKHCDMKCISYTNYKIYNFGSKIEGSTTLGLNSDIDLVYVSPFAYEILHPNQEKCQGLITLSISKSAPNGHCKLALKGKSLNRSFHYDHENNRFIPHKNFEKYFPILTDMSGLLPLLKHGPSFNFNNSDHVRGILVPASMSITSETINRLRTYQWPTDQVIDKIKEKNGLVVPIGHPQSENAFIEWRISHSFAERLLIFKFNITQLRCLTILKMIKETFFQSVDGDEFTSYHCKTILFHTIARTAQYLWREDRLFDCVQNCLRTLQVFLLNRYCPHFFDFSVNLFVGKLTPTFCQRLSDILNDLTNNELRCLLQVKIDDLGQRILNFRAVFGSNIFMSRESIEKKMIAEIVLERNQLLIEYSRYPHVEMFKLKRTLKKQIYVSFRLVRELLHIIGNEQDEVVARLMLPYYLVEHSSLLVAYRMKKKQPIAKNIIDLFRLGFHTDATSSRLKLASVLCCNKQYEESLKVLNETPDVCAPNTKHLPICFMYATTNLLSWKVCNKLSKHTLDSVLCRDTFSSCVGIKRKDIWCCPIGLRRSVLYFYNSGLPDNLDFFSFHDNYGIEVDSKVMFHYLKYLTYSSLSKNGPKVNTLKKLMQTVLENPKVWNVSFFEIINSQDKEIVDMFRKSVNKNHDKNSELSTPRLLNNLAKDPYGIIRQCLDITFSRNSIVHHTELALILIGYAFELERENDFACAFYLMSFFINPNIAAGQHLLRVHPYEVVSKYLEDFYDENTDMNNSIKLELDLIPEVVDAFSNIMKANIYLGLLQEEDFHEATYRTRCHVCLLNASVRLSDRVSSPDVEMFPTNRRIVQAKESSLFL